MTRGSRYSSELREEAVRLTSKSRMPLSRLAADLGIAPKTLRRWVRADREERTLDALQGADLVRPFRISDYSTVDPARLTAGDTVHVGDLVDPRGEAPHLYGLEHLWWGDYTGDAVARSNHRCLVQDFPRSFVFLCDAMRHQGLAVMPAALGDERLAGALLSLGEYPCYKEDDLAALEAELAGEAWDAYLSRDVSQRLRRDHGIDCDDLEIPDGQLRDLFYEAHRRRGNPYAENAVDVVFPHVDEAVADVATTLRRDPPGVQPAGAAPRRSTDPAGYRGTAFPRRPGVPGGGTGHNLSSPAPPWASGLRGQAPVLRR